MIHYIYLFYFFAFTNAYYYKTHSFLGTTLERYIEDNYNNVYLQVNNLLGEGFDKSSVWADKIKRLQKYNWSRQLHYIDINECKTNKFTNVDYYCNNNCIFTAILNMTNDIKYNRNWIDNDHTVDNFRFLLHFMQDFNQPMHLLGYERGGNDYPVNLHIHGRIRKTNMHELWDSIIPEYYLNNFKFKITELNISEINNIFDYKEFLYNMLEETLHISCKMHNKENHEIVFENYFDENVINTLFTNYMKLAVTTVLYIYS